MNMKEQLQKYMQTDDNILFAYLFGSYADGTAHAQSDVDVAIYFQNHTLDDKLSAIHALQKRVQKDIDLVTLNEVKNIFLLESVLNKGILLKDHKERPWFEVRKEHEIIDFKNFLKYIDAA